MMKEIVMCNSCREPEYWDEMRWLNGRFLCRNCYKAEYEGTTGKIYKWDDLDGERPTMEDYMRQEGIKDA